MIKNVIFDLGNVLIHIHPDEAMQQFAERCGEDFTEIRKFFLSPLHDDFMGGKIPPTKFYHKICEIYNCEIPYDEFVEIWGQVIGDPKEGIPEIIDTLAGKGLQLSVCSNTDPWHWEIALKKCDFLRHFQHFFLSYELQTTKPDSRIFEIILDRLNAPASECIFIDDLQANIEIAKTMGFHGICADNAPEIIKGLQDSGLV